MYVLRFAAEVLELQWYERIGVGVLWAAAIVAIIFGLFVVILTRLGWGLIIFGGGLIFLVSALIWPLRDVQFLQWLLLPAGTMILGALIELLDDYSPIEIDLYVNSKG